MTKLTAFVVGIFILLASFSIAEAHRNDGLEGLVIGGVSGAAIGHVVTGDPKGMIFGSFLGGTIGMIIDAGNDWNHVVVREDRQSHYRNRPDHYYRGRWSHGGDRHYYGKHGYQHRWDRHRGRHLR